MDERKRLPLLAVAFNVFFSLPAASDGLSRWVEPAEVRGPIMFLLAACHGAPGVHQRLQTQEQPLPAQDPGPQLLRRP